MCGRPPKQLEGEAISYAYDGKVGSILRSRFEEVKSGGG